MRRAARRDENEAEVVRALEQVGAAVQRLSEPGCPDLLVSFRGVLYLIEVKLPLTARGAMPRRRAHEGGDGDMTAAQVKWWREWRGKAPVVVRTTDEALAAIGAVPLVDQIMQTTGIDRAGAEKALVDGERMAYRIKAAELPADLVPDATSVHLQRKRRC